MAKELLVKLEIPIPAEPLVGTPDMIFSRWLPLGEEMAIRVQEDGVALKLWFDITSTWWASQPQESDLPKMVNVCAHRIFAEVRVDNVKDEVVDYITHRDFKRLPTEAEQSLQQQYDDLGRRILTLLLQRLNKLIAFVRSVKGQFWLTEYPLNLDRMHSTFMEFKGQVRTDEGGWYRFEPATGDHLVITLIPEEKFIDQDTWRRAQEFTCGSSRSPLVGTLLAGAESLAGHGHSRSALTEAVTALEVAVYEFAANPNAEKAFSSKVVERIGVVSLRKQVEHMGLTGTVSYLLPIIVPEALLPVDVLTGCQNAIAQRQNVVHNGQRDVSAQVLRVSLNSIRKLCTILEQLTLPTPIVPAGKPL